MGTFNDQEKKNIMLFTTYIGPNNKIQILLYLLKFKYAIRTK